MRLDLPNQERQDMKAAANIIAGIGLVLVGALTVAFSLDDALDHGKDVYAMQKCALCHSIAGIGGKKIALDGVGSKLKLDVIKKWIRTPKEMKPDTTMKPYPNLLEKDLDDLSSYLMTLR
jgi:mono/diheme cytochrome c family protein